LDVPTDQEREMTDGWFYTVFVYFYKGTGKRKPKLLCRMSIPNGVNFEKERMLTLYKGKKATRYSIDRIRYFWDVDGDNFVMYLIVSKIRTVNP